MKRALALILFLAFASAARADSPQPYSPQYALKMAETHWHGRLPACGWPTVLYRTGSDVGLRVEGPYYWVGTVDRASCILVLRARNEWYPTWNEFCRVTVHEYGHLLGYGHSTNPQDIMYPLAGGARECINARRVPHKLLRKL